MVLIRKIFILFSIILLISCKLTDPKDTTDPMVNLTIAGGNEISRGVTLYLDIEDDSDIESVSIMIDDTTAYTVEDNFEVIRFDVTPLADESEHVIYAVVEDSEGNIGESEKLNVVITEFPGWRIFDTIPIEYGYLTIDENDRIWLSDYSNVYVYDTVLNTYKHINDGHSDFPIGVIDQIRVVEGSKVWILHGLRLSEYDYDTNTWIKTIDLPPDTIEGAYPPNVNGLFVQTFAIDSNKDLWIGAVYSSQRKKLIKYSNQEFKFYPQSTVYQIRNMLFHPDGTLYLFGDPGVDAFKNEEIYSFNDFPYSPGWDLTMALIDSSGYVWTTGRGAGALRYNGTIWERIYIPETILVDGTVIGHSDYLNPIFTTSDGITFFERFIETGENQYGGKSYNSCGITTFNGTGWTMWDQHDSPFSNFPKNPYQYDNQGFRVGGYYGIGYQKIVETSNGDIWLILSNGEEGIQFMRYRPSLGGYP